MDQISYAHSAKQSKRIKRFIAEPDSTSGLVSLPKVIEAGESITIPDGRVVVHPNLEINGTLTIKNDGELFIPFGGTLASSDLMHPVDTIDDLRNETGKYKYAYVTGYHTKDDGAFGSNMFVWNEDSTETDNGGTIIKCTTVTNGRYKLKYSEAVNVKWFGAKGDGVTDDTVAFEISATTGKTVFVPEGNYILSAHVDGNFIATRVAKFSRPLPVSYVDAEEIGRLAALAYESTFVSTLEAYNDRAIQSLVYDKFSNLVYFTSNYNGEGTFIYAFDWETKNLIGSNHILDVEAGSAFYGAFPHQGMGLYRPDEMSEPLFFCAGNQYTAAGVADPIQHYKLNLIAWDYKNPHSFTISRSWQLWDPALYNAVYANVCVSEDGTQLCANTTRTADGVTVFGVWKISDILATPDGGDLTAKALRIFDSPYPWFNIVGQGMACDDKYIYTLTSGADLDAHFISVIDIITGIGVHLREGSREGDELDLPNVTMYEGEALGFLPENGRSRLILGVSINNESGNTPHLYNMESPSLPLGEKWIRTLKQGATGTSADFDNLNIGGKYYVTSGLFSDLSGGAWILEVLWPNSYSARQIAYRGNANNDIRVRTRAEVWSAWSRIIMPNANGYVTSYPRYFDGSATYDIADRTGAGLYKWQAKLTTGSLGLSAYGVDDFYLNTAVGKENAYSVVVSANELGKSFTNSVDSAGSLGVASKRWSQLYAATGAINTSDARVKTFSSIPEVEKQVAVELKGLMRRFKFNDAIETKGIDNARIHYGTSAQEVISVFEKYGLNALQYAMVCYDEWEEQEELKDEEGNVTQEYREAGNRYGIRYEELLCFIMSAV